MTLRVVRTILVLGILLLLPALPASSGSCSSSSECKDCGFSQQLQRYECAGVTRDANCTCTSFGSFCDLEGVCDYTGSGGGGGCTQGGICEEQQ